MKNRREFIKTATVLTLGGMAMRAFPFSIQPPQKNLIGLQLWTLRDTIVDDTLDTLKKISKIGYNSIEPYDFNGLFYGFEAREFRQIVEDLGMKLTSTHTGISLENAGKYTEAAAEAGLEYLVLPSFMGRPNNTADDFKRLAEEMNKIGEITRQAGIRFGYHNHAFEFKNSEDGVLFDILLNETEPELVSFQLDIFWVIKGDQDPLAYIKKYPGRFETWHVKDLGGDGKSTIIGKGEVDYKEVFSVAETSGMKRFYVEQEEYQLTPIESVGESYRYIAAELVNS